MVEEGLFTKWGTTRYFIFRSALVIAFAILTLLMAITAMLCTKYLKPKLIPKLLNG